MANNKHTSEDRVAEIAGIPGIPNVAATAGAQDFHVTRNWMSGEKVRCIIHSGQDDTSKAPVYVSVNDYDAYFPRDEEVIIPVEAFKVLSDGAVYEHLSRNERGELITKRVRRFQFTALERIPAAARAA